MPDKWDQYAEQSGDGDKWAKYASDAAAESAPVDMSEKNYGTSKPEGEGFVAHASKTLRDLPDAFTSGRLVSGPLKSLSDSMGEFIASPTLHNSIRAIPGAGMLEDTISAPYRTGASGDTAGAWGDALDLAGQAALGLHGRVAEPLREVGAMPSAETSAPLIPQSMIDATHLLPIKGAPVRMGMRLINGGAKMLGKSEAPGRVYDTSVMPGFGNGVEVDRTPQWDGIRNANAPIIAEPGSKIGQNPFANPLDPAGSLPSGKIPGGIHNVLEPVQRPERPPALWQQYGAGPVASESADFTPIQSDLPSGRYPVSSRFPEPAVPPRPARIPGWMERGISVTPDQSPDFTPIRGTHPSGRAPGAFDVPHQSQILPQSIRPVPLSESPDMSDILQQSIDRIKARKNDSAALSDIPLGSPLKVRRRK